MAVMSDEKSRLVCDTLELFTHHLSLLTKFMSFAGEPDKI
jgi:hypothetical protein